MWRITADVRRPFGAYASTSSSGKNPYPSHITWPFPMCFSHGLRTTFLPPESWEKVSVGVMGASCKDCVPAVDF